MVLMLSVNDNILQNKFICKYRYENKFLVKNYRSKDLGIDNLFCYTYVCVKTFESIICLKS